MITGLDHVVVLTGDISAGEAAYQSLFARTPAWRSGGDGEAAERIRAVLAAQGEGLASLCFRTSDITKLHRRLDRLTLKPDPVAEVESRDAISGATLSWKRTRTATEASRGVRLFFLERDKERPLSVRTTTGSITAMDHVVVSTSDPERAAALYGARLGLDMALGSLGRGKVTEHGLFSKPASRATRESVCSVFSAYRINRISRSWPRQSEF